MQNSLVFSAQEGDLEAVTAYVHARWLSQADIDKPGDDGRTALYCAAAGGHASVVQFLLVRGANPLAVITAGGELDTCLAAAARQGHTEVCTVLLRRGTDHIDLETTSLDLPPLVWAALGEHDATAQLLLKSRASPAAAKRAAERKGIVAIAARFAQDSDKVLTATTFAIVIMCCAEDAHEARARADFV